MRRALAIKTRDESSVCARINRKEKATMMTFIDVVFSGSDASGKRITRTVKQIKATDAYAAGDKIKAMFKRYDRCVVIKFGTPTKISAQVARIARNAGPEEM